MKTRSNEDQVSRERRATTPPERRLESDHKRFAVWPGQQHLQGGQLEHEQFAVRARRLLPPELRSVVKVTPALTGQKWTANSIALKSLRVGYVRTRRCGGRFRRTGFSPGDSTHCDYRRQRADSTLAPSCMSRRITASTLFTRIYLNLCGAGALEKPPWPSFSSIASERADWLPPLVSISEPAVLHGAEPRAPRSMIKVTSTSRGQSGGTSASQCVRGDFSLQEAQLEHKHFPCG